MPHMYSAAVCTGVCSLMCSFLHVVWSGLKVAQERACWACKYAQAILAVMAVLHSWCRCLVDRRP